MQMKATLLGWYNYDPSIFEGLVVPEELEKETVIDSILMRCGEFSIIYSNPEFLKFAITNWSERHKRQFERIYKALTEDYNPIHNYDRYEEITDKRQGEKSSTEEENLENTVTANSGSTSGGTSENRISADNAESYQPDNINITDNKTNTNSTEKANGKNNTDYNDNYNEDYTHNGHLYGNIGVTTSMSMVEDETNLRYRLGIYDIIASKFVEEFCIAIY